MAAFYNDNEPFVCQWLRNLINAGHLPHGDICQGDIETLIANDLNDYNQCHFFAGIGGWPYALKLAGWGDRPVWTGSCPCQPLSSAGQRKGHADKRHLWPAFYSLIAQCHPSTIFGEQVASKDGREWLAGVRADLEALGYAFGATDLPAASVAAPHKRQRIFWVADSHINGWSARDQTEPSTRYRNGIKSADRQHYLRLSNGASCRSGTAQSGNGEEEAHCRWSHPASSYRRFTDSLGNNYRIPESDVPFVADGFPGIVACIAALGNAVVPQVAAEFVSAFLDL